MLIRLDPDNFMRVLDCNQFIQQNLNLDETFIDTNNRHVLSTLKICIKVFVQEQNVVKCPLVS